MVPLLRLLAISAASTFAGQFIGALGPVKFSLRKISIGVSLVLSSLLAWATALFFLLLGLFFYLGNVDQYIAPALWTGVISLGIGFILVFWGLKSLRR